MPSLRDCCRHPRASSPGLPNVQLVPSPTQDEGYDDDAVRISTPDEIVIESVRPSPDEPRPSSDTVVHHELLQRLNREYYKSDNGGGNQPRSKSLRVQRVNSIHIPRRRSHTQSQPLSSSSSAALEHYVNISPSRAALRKRLQSVDVINEGEAPPPAKLEPARITSIPESSIPSHWRLSYNASSSSFRQPGLREVDTNEHQGEFTKADKSKSASDEQKAELKVLQQDDHPEKYHCRLENERHIGNEAPTSTGTAVARAPRSKESARDVLGSYQSGSTEVSVHLYDMQISERVASSNSNIVSLGDMRFRRQRSSTLGSRPMLATGTSHNRRSAEGSSLESPKESSSIYSSNEDELASSRRSSMLLIQGLPERIRKLKNHATSGDLYSTSAQHSQITVIPRSRFPTTLTDEVNQQDPSNVAAHEIEAGLDHEDVYKRKSRSPPLRRSSTEPRLNRFKRGAPASFDGSGEWQLSPPSRQPIGHLPRQPTGLLPRQSTGLLVRQPTRLLTPEDPASVWEKALREHAQEDNAISRARPGSISYEIGRDDFRSRIRSRRFTRTPSPLQEIVEDPWSHKRKRESQSASGRESRTEAVNGRSTPTGQGLPAPRTEAQVNARQASSPSRSVDSWTRYPSHTLAERTEAASAKDNVITRDFGAGQSPDRKPSKKKSRSMTFGRKFLHTVGRLYKTRSSDFRRYHAGHRSSIAVGGVLEYPELEIPGPIFDPVLLSGPGDRESDTTIEREAALREAIRSPIPSSPEPPQEEEPQLEVSIPSPELNVVDWQKTYDDCVVRPRNTSTDEEIAPDEIGPNNALNLELDEAQQAEVDKARDEALKAADDCLRRSMELVRYPKRFNCP
ncbi:MAG: hypothetical protein Q9216_003593 [Gyalolechia sp. 2 TL-2023]